MGLWKSMNTQKKQGVQSLPEKTLDEGGWMKEQPVAEASNLWPAGCLQPRMAVNAAQHKIINLLKTL